MKLPRQITVYGNPQACDAVTRVHSADTAGIKPACGIGGLPAELNAYIAAKLSQIDARSYAQASRALRDAVAKAVRLGKGYCHDAGFNCGDMLATEDMTYNECMASGAPGEKEWCSNVNHRCYDHNYTNLGNCRLAW